MCKKQGTVIALGHGMVWEGLQGRAFEHCLQRAVDFDGWWGETPLILIKMRTSKNLWVMSSPSVWSIEK